ncbi:MULTISPECIES: hypothetical protein [Streptomyces]|uniref:Lipoprotein n=1 Tax=Streptomyces glycanivorans TaxID=3033808 RepID=A0ABY9J9R4_9ACTN|nr:MULTISPECIES: hypothetical protein [unclassified Streptomyces]TXS17743.1 hypothetical protein EAO68_08345 [Streptomyces sp. wa22]WLQ64536.1 hypothetical protein P8A20_13455 [Streptomyces sp. Alt3]WSR08619.1 hypothetical protein OG265_22610 [Streptomyces sp. NBC_01208]WSR48632.1 hypothetical protein OG279_13780 [Streptomyces sp. NBC_01201]
MTRSERAYGAPRRSRGPRRALAALAAVVAGAALATGCGIRSTSVPVDAGAAPSRMPCRTASAEATTPPLPESVAVRVYLVCASQLVTVERTVEIDESRSAPLLVAQALLGELQREPDSDERRAGFSTDVPTGLRVSDAREGDPDGTLRLSEQPDDLPAEALAQVVCSYADNEPLGSGGSVLLGGPGKYAPRGYLCTSETKSRPGEVPTLGAVELS